MTRRVFLSYHHRLDAFRASQVRNSGVIETTGIASDDDWLSITREGDDSIRTWIDGHMAQADCVVVLIGQITAGRKWIEYEMQKAWQDGRGLFGVHIHNLKNHYGSQTSKGANPFAGLTVDGVAGALVGRLRVYDPPHLRCLDVSRYIVENLAEWVEIACATRPGVQRRGVTRSVNSIGADEPGAVSRIA